MSIVSCLRRLVSRLKLPWITFGGSQSSHSTSRLEWSLIKTSALRRGLGGPQSSLLMEASPTCST